MNQVIPLEEAARRTGVHRTTLSRAVKRGELRARTVQAHGKTRFWLDPAELEAWVRDRAQAAPCAHEDAPRAHGVLYEEADSEPSTVHTVHPGSPEFVRLLELLECAHERARCASVQAVRLQHELNSYQRALTEHAESLVEREARAKTAEARLMELEQRQQELEVENERRLQEALSAQEEVTARLHLAEERVSWLERRIPRWIRRALGA
jgi:excisionase family DNA binding protein